MGGKAVVLSSGGLDSTTAMAVARDEGFEVYAMSFRYGQRHLQELDMAKKVAAFFNAARHIVVDFDMRTIGGSALTDEIEVPKDRGEVERSAGIPVTYVPARNTIFLAFALAWAEVVDAAHIFIGTNAVDFSGYPDCRPAFLEAFERAAVLGTRAGVEGRGVKIHAPLSQMSKADIIRKGIALGIDYAMTHSCYDPTPEGLACGACDACVIRLKGFREAGIEDPVPYVAAE